MDWNVISSNLPLLLQGALVTVEITAMSVGVWIFYRVIGVFSEFIKF